MPNCHPLNEIYLQFSHWYLSTKQKKQEIRQALSRSFNDQRRDKTINPSFAVPKPVDDPVSRFLGANRNNAQ